MFTFIQTLFFGRQKSAGEPSQKPTVGPSPKIHFTYEGKVFVSAAEVIKSSVFQDQLKKSREYFDSRSKTARKA